MYIQISIIQQVHKSRTTANPLIVFSSNSMRIFSIPFWGFLPYLWLLPLKYYIQSKCLSIIPEFQAPSLTLLSTKSGKVRFLCNGKPIFSSPHENISHMSFSDTFIHIFVGKPNNQILIGGCIISVTLNNPFRRF